MWASLVAQMVKNPSAIRETWVQSLDCEGPLEKGTVTHSSILAKLPAALAPKKRVSWFFEALMSDIDFPCLAMKVLDGIIFKYNTLSSTLKNLLFTVVTFINYLS